MSPFDQPYTVPPTLPDEVLIDKEHARRLTVGVEHRLGQRDLHVQRISAVGELGEPRTQRP